MSRISTGERIINVSSNVDKMYNSFFGTYKILEGQYIHLENFNLSITNNQIRIYNNAIEPEIITLTFKNNKLRFFQSELLPSMKFSIVNIEYKNIKPDSPLPNLIDNVFFLTAPNTIYISYHPVQNLYSIKNINMATCFLMTKVK